MPNFEVFSPKCEVLLLDTAQREDVCNQHKRDVSACHEIHQRNRKNSFAWLNSSLLVPYDLREITEYIYMHSHEIMALNPSFPRVPCCSKCHEVLKLDHIRAVQRSWIDTSFERIKS